MWDQLWAKSDEAFRDKRFTKKTQECQLRTRAYEEQLEDESRSK